MKINAAVKNFVLSMIATALLFFNYAGCSGGTTGTGGRQINGSVTSSTGAKLNGVLVEILESGESTLTDENGQFTLETSLADADLELQFSSPETGIDTSLSISELPADADIVEVDVVIDPPSNEITSSSVTINPSGDEERNSDVESPDTPDTSLCNPGMPVCGMDSNTYVDACAIETAGIEIAYTGACLEFSRVGANGEIICTGPPPLDAKVCGENRVTYPSECIAYTSGATVAYHGECDAAVDCNPDPVCGTISTCLPGGMVCGKDNQTYASAEIAAFFGIGVAYHRECIEYSRLSNGCTFNCSGPPPLSAAVCGDGINYPSEVTALISGASDIIPGICNFGSDCPVDPVCGILTSCPPGGAVCGKDQQTYASAAAAAAAGVGVGYHYPCIEHSNLNQNCAFSCTGPPPSDAAVCGSDGQTYASECMAISAGTSVASSGPCGFSSDCNPDEVCGVLTTCPVNGAVCGKDNISYPSAAAAAAAGIGVAYHRDCLDVSYLVACTPVCAGPPLTSDQVCGIDGVTYASECVAIVFQGVQVAYPGPC